MVALALQIGASAAPARAAYQEQNSPLTLTDGLEEYYCVNAEVVSRPDTLEPQSRWLFRSHDMCHVIFGLGTSLADETIADTRTLLSCDVGWSKYARYLESDPQAKAIFRALGWPRVVAITLRTVPRIVRTGRSAAYGTQMAMGAAGEFSDADACRPTPRVRHQGHLAKRRMPVSVTSMSSGWSCGSRWTDGTC